MNPQGAPEDEVDAFARSVRVERDVVFFLHQQAAYSSICDDLDWGFFDEDYSCALLENREMPIALQRGCLALLYAMGMCEAGNVGVAIGDRLPKALADLKLFATNIVEVEQLRDTAIRALTYASTPQQLRDWNAIETALGASHWVHQVAVRPYFRAIASML